MAFEPPTFNIVCNIFTGLAPPAGLRLAAVPCNLAAGRRGRNSEGEMIVIGLGGGMWLLLPARTDIRDFASASGADSVECPAGSGRYYQVEWVDDSGRGFSNESRFALLFKLVPWPTPYP